MVDEEVFTYDDLYDILREELATKDLESMNLKTIKKIKKYIESKEDLLKKAKTSKFSKERRRLLEEIENARHILVKINQKRTKKIITRAVFTVRSESGAKDTSNMLPFEKKFYNTLIESLEEEEGKFFSTIENLKIEKEKPKKETKELKSKEKEKEETKENDITEVRVLEDIPQLTGPDLKNYGPYKKGDVAEIPAEIATLIINKKKGKKIK